MEDLGTDERILLQRILKNLGWKSVDWVQLAGFCEYGRETSGDIKSMEFS
jgi:hypothetical protein